MNVLVSTMPVRIHLRWGRLTVRGSEGVFENKFADTNDPPPETWSPPQGQQLP